MAQLSHLLCNLVTGLVDSQLHLMSRDFCSVHLGRTHTKAQMHGATCTTLSALEMEWPQPEHSTTELRVPPKR